MNYTIRPATEEDFPAILGLVKELALFEKAPEKVTNTVEQMKQEKHLFESYVAALPTGEVIGMALWFYAYYTWVGKSLYLDDIYVKEQYRRHRVGTALMRKVFDAARRENCNRVRWQVLDWNVNAIEMYKKAGATIDDEWLNCDFDRKGIFEFNM